MTRVDVVVAVRNEEEAIPLFLEAIRRLRFEDLVELRVLFVEDSSTDRTPELLRALAAEDPRVGFLRLRRGYGQALAVAFGVAHSDADAIVMMDVDGSHPVDVIPELVARYREGASVVQCVRRSLPNRQMHRRIGAEIFHAIARVFSGVDTRLQNIFFRLVARRFMNEILGQPRYLTYLRFPLPLNPAGATQYIYVDTEERRVGTSKYNAHRLLTLALDGLLSQTPPVRFAAWMSLAAILCVLLVVASHVLLAGLLALFAMLLAHRYVVSGYDVLGKIEVEENGLENWASNRREFPGGSGEP